MTTATLAAGTRTMETAASESELRAAARAHDEAARGQQGRVCGLPVAGCDGAQAMDSEDAREGCLGVERGSRAGDRLLTGRRGKRGEQLHPGARP